MLFGIWGAFKRNRENILYTIVTVFLLERVRRGWNRIEDRGRREKLAVDIVERRQQTFMFGAALLYALPLVLPIVKYIYRSANEIAGYVGTIPHLNNLWVFLGLAVVVELFIAVVVYNLLGIYVEKMNVTLGFFARQTRAVVAISRSTATRAHDAGLRVGRGVRRAASRAIWGTPGVATDGGE